MESKILNFPDAMRLAQIVTKYIDVADGEKIALDFIDDFVNKISPNEYKECIELFLGEKLDKENLPTGDELIGIIYTGMRNNNIFLLLETYKSLGLG